MSKSITEIKREWLINYMQDYHNVDVANKTFVDRYVEQFAINDIGGHLSSMFKEGLLDRTSYGLPKRKSSQPKWVYVYKLKN